jgi:hypothetical protein
MSSTAIQAQEALQREAAEASHAQKHEDAETVVEQREGLHRDILTCPICMKSFSPPVY